MEVLADRTKRAAAHHGVGGAPGQRRGAGNHVAGTEGQVIGKDDVAGRVAQCPRTGFHVGGNGDDVLRAGAVSGGAAVRADANEGAARDGEPVGVAVQGAFGTGGVADGHQDATGDGQGAVGVHGIVMTAVGIRAPAAQLRVHAGTDAVVGGDHLQVPAAHAEDGLGFDAFGREAVVAFVVRVPGRGAGGGDVDRAAVDGDARIGIVIGTGGEGVLPGLPAGGDALVVAADGDVSVVDGHETQRLHGTFLATDLDALARRRIDGQPAAIHDEGLGGTQPVAGVHLERQVATAQT